MITLAAAPALTDQLQGWGTAAGALITAALLIYEVVTGRRARKEAAQDRAEAAKDRARLDEERRDAEKAHARTIAITDARVFSRQVRFTILNCGAGPIIDLEARIEVHTPEGIVVQKTIETADMIRPGAEHSVDSHTGRSMIGPPGTAPERIAEAARIEIIFTDMAGLRWRRVNNGQPERATG